MSLRGTRDDSHAGGKNAWYYADPPTLTAKLDEYLEGVPDAIDGISLPVPRARAVIAPHAGYSYSGRCAAWAYKCLNLSAARRVFILGPSHHYGLPGCALTSFAEYKTPFGNLVVDEDIVGELWDTGMFSEIPTWADVAEHSLEMHLPYLYKRLEQTHGGDKDKWPTIVPILVGSTGMRAEKKFGNILLPYLKDPENAFIISSDFCHWGPNFEYYNYFSLTAAREMEKREKAEAEAEERERAEGPDKTRCDKKTKRVKRCGGELEPALVSYGVFPREKEDMEIHESIKMLDDQSIAAVETGIHENFLRNLKQTGNTVCGRHPIGVMMAAMEALNKENLGGPQAKFKMVKYDRSDSELKEATKSSVSYVSFYSVV
ncbi:UPF0103-domain-containing protein [Phialemonium atrogriseum]|uniref:UPF0103-domain-containing protein n=1 Tax=Phialemonium atrogriseum TaxID=1093897 RepID=A0AAJ0BS24_9PEZI|nr:UPF0103-domain-containing protein [Phialemonium atrogriseum]KAK1762079.1 UPF0103-domain-containing protein [Phialemonium atrogriseum]